MNRVWFLCVFLIISSVHDSFYANAIVYTNNCNPTPNCQSCVDGLCYATQNNGKSMSYNNCPPAVCCVGCNTLLMYTDNCPVCGTAGGRGTRQPCNSNAQCTSGATCNTAIGLCQYASLPANLPQACIFSSGCNPKNNCVNGRCVTSSNGGTHEGVSCTSDSQCKADQTCKQSICVDKGQNVGGLGNMFPNGLFGPGGLFPNGLFGNGGFGK